MTKTIRVHADSFDYTRRGLKSREPIPLTVGQHNRIVVIRPRRVRAIQGGNTGFAKDTSFPLPGTLVAFWRAKELGEAFSHHGERDAGWDQKVFQVYGHCSESGDEGHNKKLADRRARVGQALLTSDVELFRSVADEEGWGDAEVQSMLRVLACDPGPVDGKPGRLTEAAIAQFAERYNRGVYHRGGGVEPSQTLETDGKLTEAVRVGLLEAFVVAQGAGFESDRLHPQHPAHGCSEYNRIDLEKVAPNRRLAIIGHPEPPEFSEHAPCVAGDEQACAVVDDKPMRCMWYRDHVTEAGPVAPMLFDPRWLWLGEDRYALSALTTADDGTPVHFELMEPPPGSGGSSEPSGPPLQGEVRGGVAAVVWSSGQAPRAEDGRPPTEHTPRFRASHPGQASSVVEADWPTRRTLRVLQIADDPDAIRARKGGLRLLALDGSYEHFSPFASAEPESKRHMALEFPDVPGAVRVDLLVESGDLRWPIFERAGVEALPGNCRSGDKCEELPPPPGPPQYSLDEIELDWSASVGVAEDEEATEGEEEVGFDWIEES